MEIIKGYTDGSIKRLEKPDVLKRAIKKNALMIVGGEFAITKDVDSLPIATILGSCVSVILYDQVAKIKGMNHFLLPKSFQKAASYRYGTNAMEIMMNEMYKLGCKKKNLVAKIAGGATIIRHFSEKIGDKNVEFARIFCKKEGIPILSEHVLGERGRMIVVDDGCNAMVRTFKNTIHDEQLAVQEQMIEEELTSRLRSCDFYTLWNES